MLEAFDSDNFQSEYSRIGTRSIHVSKRTEQNDTLEKHETGK